MAFRCVKGDSTSLPYNRPANGSSITAGNILQLDTTNNGVKIATATSTTDTVNAIECVAVETLATSAVAAQINAIPINSQQLWEADCTNNTAANQLYLRQILTDAGTVANTSSDTATTSAFFLPLMISGIASDKKLIGRLIKLGQLAT